MPTYLTDVEISPGMFSDEAAVFLRDYRGEEYSGFVSKDHIRDGMLEVSILEQTEELALIQSADRGDGHEFLNGKRSLTVMKEELVYLD